MAVMKISHVSEAERAGTSFIEMPCEKTATRILAVWTRELDATDQVGRVKTARQIDDALQDAGIVTSRRLTNAFEEPRPIRSLVSSMIALLAGLLSGRPLPLQCAIFVASARQSALLADGLDADVVYLDGIRTLLWLRRLRRLAPRLRIVVDFDDLMSRRYEHLSRRDLPFSLGYLERMLPRPMSRLTLAKNISRAVLWYERHALRTAEREILQLADTVVLVNCSEAAMLREIGASARQPLRATIVVVPPAAKPCEYEKQSTCPKQPNGWHAIFVGSDMLVQNRTAITYLLDLWSTFRIATELRIYGRQKSIWPSIPNVTFCGYVSDIAEAYKPGSILVYPCRVPGGIKTKVLEAFAYRTPVIGNALTFEGILPADYPLVIDDQADLVALLKDPASHAEDLMRATHIASAYLAQEHSPASFAIRWRQVILGIADAR
jgi:glycosyltransferase involved in cell wall biosynthesis